jgi:putative oxidoreductase
MPSMAESVSQPNLAPSRGLIARVFGAHASLGSWLERQVEPVFNVGVRVWMAKIFFDSGLIRVSTWEKQAGLFTDIHPVPGVPGMIAAALTTAGELALPVLLVLGLLTRLPALGLLAMTMVIQFVAAQTPQGIENGIGHPQHYLWMFLLGYLAIRGGGSLALDRILAPARR